MSDLQNANLGLVGAVFEDPNDQHGGRRARCGASCMFESEFTYTKAGR